MRQIFNTAILALAGAETISALSNSLSGGRKTIRDFRREVELGSRLSSLRRRDSVDPVTLYTEYNFSTPIDHFHNETKYAPHVNGTFPLRYWFDAQYYKPGGPVIILQSGETGAEDRLVYLQKGLLHELAEATNGIGVVLEHRYYGTSFPTEDLSTENLRFLTTQQALADEAYFARNIRFPGLERYGDLTSKTTAYIGYGGSYAGAFNAFLRVLYPDVFFGTISSSGVVKAIWDYWAYFEPIAQYGPHQCITTQKTLTHIVDNILIGKKDNNLTLTLKAAFGMANVTYATDFTNQLSQGIQYWQSLNWDPEVSDPEFFSYCANITDSEVLYPDTEGLRSIAKHLIEEGEYSPSETLVNQFLNYIGYVNLTQVAPCFAEGETQDQCFSNHNTTFYKQDSLDQYPWRSWPYQYCTEWGFLQTGSGVPTEQLPLISRTLDLEYETLVCRGAFNITEPANIEIINQYGGYDISYPRLAIVDGDRDPWRPTTPHAFGYGAKPRISTASEPFILISNAVHHFDENGRFPNETTPSLPPLPVADTQKNEIAFVKEWMQEWQLRCLVLGGCS
nr:putative extracellular serine carboxypeptidase [Quercus suber]